MRILKTFHQKIKPLLDNVKPIECALIASALWWAFILFIPMDTFSDGTAYQAMAGIASEETWSLIFLMVGAISTYGMIFENKKVRLTGLMLSNGLWFFVSAMFAVSNIASTGTGIYFIVGCLNLFVIYKVAYVITK